MDATFYMETAVFNYRVAAIMIVDDHVLIHKQVKDKHWALPGGRVELLEDSQTSIVREVKEELGIDVKVDRLLWFTENFFDYNNKNYHEIGLYYKVSPTGGRFTFQSEAFFGEEGDRLVYQWVPIDQLEKILLYPEFIRTSLRDLPDAPKHLIIKKYSI
ncbi:NUDIX hydrolase [Mesobacillus subterraneus]|uniref:NUDIX hydrolase n=1 Tax=Mesobacillus subterraneus TaxID=285983 RepID=UPI00203DA0DB|nr:NUDIX hydrolase [Mesobacillus subterraneus]MCM3666137.1 NUDIX hydrolase [Mesobacillus subterraneus]MCM3685135.1 NUDIX hydrolase [Mesobacillus subterraneus]